MLRLSSYSAFWWARSTPRIQKVSKVLQKFRKIIFQMSNGPFPRKYDGADWHALRLFFTGPFMCRLLKKSYEIMFPDPMSFYKSNHKPSHSPFGGHGFSHPSARISFQALRRGTPAEWIGWFHALPVAALGVLAPGRWKETMGDGYGLCMFMRYIKYPLVN